MKKTAVARRALCCVLCAAFVLGALALTGCVTDYKRRDIVKYVKEQYGISGFKVNSKRQPLYGEDGYIDYLWTVTESDGTVFYVIDDRYYSTEWASNSLTDNRSVVILSRYIDKNGSSGLEVVPDESPAGWPDMGSFHLLGNYHSRAELRGYIDALNTISAGLPKGCRIPFLLRYDHKFRTIADYENSAADFTELFYSQNTLSYDQAEPHYLHTALDMRYEENIAEFTEDEIHELVKNNAYSMAVMREDGTCDFYDDLIMDRFGYGISFATMYEIMKREGYPVDGDKDDYTFTGVDGSEYEFSNYFSDGDWYYYLKDGERVKMQYYFYDHIFYTRLKDFSGIRIVDFTDYRKHHDQYIEEAAASSANAQTTVTQASSSDAEDVTGTTAAQEDRMDSTSYPVIIIEAGGKTFRAQPEDNSSAQAFIESMRGGPLELELSDYGNFEKVGPLGFELPTNDEVITTVPGDVILYQGSQLTIYYDENTWKFTRLARINGATREQLLDAMGEGDVSVKIWVEWSE